MQPLISGTLIEAGVDYITATTDTKQGFDKYADLARAMLHSERDRGNDVKHASFEGYVGFKSGSVFGGAQAGRMLLRLSGHVAQEHWKPVALWSSNISRLDVQATVRLHKPDARLAARAERAALRHIKERNLKTKVRLIRDSQKGETLYIGRRVSDRFARLYNKYTETGEEVYKDCWRAELELKRALARNCAAKMLQPSRNDTLSSDIVFTHFRRLGVSCQQATSERLCGSIRRIGDDDSSRRLQYLSRQVRPLIAKLRGRVTDRQLLEALGLGDLIATANGARIFTEEE